MAVPTVQRSGSAGSDKRARPRRFAKAGAEGSTGLPSAGIAQRRRRLPWAVLGVLLVACSVLGFALWTFGQAERSPVLVAATDIDAGQVIGRADVATVSVGADAGVRLLGVGDLGLVVGEVARGPIPAGTPLSALLVAEADAVPAGRSIVGASLAPGEYPTSALRAGDRVELVGVVSGSLVGEERVEDLGVGVVWTVERFVSGPEPRLFVSLAVVSEDAAVVANAVSQGRLRLVLVGAEA